MNRDSMEVADELHKLAITVARHGHYELATLMIEAQDHIYYLLSEVEHYESRLSLNESRDSIHS